MPEKLTHTGAQASRSPPVRLVIAVCPIMASATQPAMSSLIQSSAQCQIFTPEQCATISQSGSDSSNWDHTKFISNGTRRRIRAVLSLQRTRSRRPFQGTSQEGFSVAANDPFQQGWCVVSLAPREAVQPLIFLSPETSRGPPRAAAQSPRLLDVARDRPAPHPCASSPPSEFHLHISSLARKATCPPIRTSLAGNAAAPLAAASLSTKHNQTVHSQDPHEIQPSLTNSRNNPKDSKHELEPELCNA
jgi:hypothetical protein